MVALVNSLSQLKRSKIVVLGDLLLDSYTMGRVQRISPEAPVPVVCVEKETHLPGGAGNVALNLVSLGAEAIFVGRVGEDFAGQLLQKTLKDKGVTTNWLFSQAHYPTPVKNRVIASNQQIVRIDHETIQPLSLLLEQEIITALPQILQGIKVVALSDYGKGFLTPNLLKALFHYTSCHGITVITDPKGTDFSKYRGTTIIKAYQAVNFSQEVDLSEVAHAILKVTEAQTVMITRSEAGLSLFNRQGERKDFPVQVREVKDVTGAGDTVLAMLTYAIANEISYEESAEFCNIAAGIVIEQLGCARVNLADISHRLLEKQMHCKLFDEKQLFALEKVLTHCPYTILVLEELSSITPTLFEALSKLSTPDSSLLLYLKDGSPCSTSLKMLTSLMEVNFILIHSAKVEKVCHQLTPKAVYSFYSGQLEQHSSLKRSLFQKNKN